MLVDFTFENFKCYRDQQAFSMRRYNRSGYALFDDVSTVTAIYGQTRPASRRCSRRWPSRQGSP